MTKHSDSNDNHGEAADVGALRAEGDRPARRGRHVIYIYIYIHTHVYTHKHAHTHTMSAEGDRPARRGRHVAV